MDSALYNDSAFEATEARNKGIYRLAATTYWEAFQSFPDRWDSDRWATFYNYTAMVLCIDFRSSLERDLVALKAIMEDKKELKLYRIEAAFSLGLLLNNGGNREEAADCFRQAIEMKVPKQEKRHKVKTSSYFFSGSVEAPPSLQLRRMEELIAPIVNDCKDWLQRLVNNGYHSPCASSPRHQYPATTVTIQVGETSTLSGAERRHLFIVGGERCDCCDKSRKELGRTLLDVCQRCERAYYCGRDCQTKQWNAGHKRYCRKPGQFKPGDLVLLMGLQSKPEMNGLLTEIVGEDPRTKGRWLVKNKEGTKSISVASEKMQQLRPLK